MWGRVDALRSAAEVPAPPAPLRRPAAGESCLDAHKDCLSAHNSCVAGDGRLSVCRQMLSVSAGDQSVCCRRGARWRGHAHDPPARAWQRAGALEGDLAAAHAARDAALAAAAQAAAATQHLEAANEEQSSASETRVHDMQLAVRLFLPTPLVGGRSFPLLEPFSLTLSTDTRFSLLSHSIRPDRTRRRAGCARGGRRGVFSPRGGRAGGAAGRCAGARRGRGAGERLHAPHPLPPVVPTRKFLNRNISRSDYRSPCRRLTPLTRAGAGGGCGCRGAGAGGDGSAAHGQEQRGGTA